MRILYLHRTRGEGVEAVHIHGIVNAFRNLGHEVAVFSPDGVEQGESNSPLKADGSGSYPSRSIMEKFSRAAPEFLFECAELIYNLPGYSAASAAVKRLRCDFIFERYAIFGMVGARLSAQLSLPWILEINYTSQSQLVRKRSRVLLPLAKFLEKKMFARAAGLVAVSSFLKDQLTNEYGVPPARVVVLPNAADSVVFCPEVQPQRECCGRPLEGKIIGFVGGFYPWHGLDLLLDAFLLIEDEFPSSKLLLVGDGPDKRRLEDRVERSGVGHRVFFAGSIPHRDLPKWISSFHIGVMPDSNPYGSPMKIFEYMAMGKPVVVPDYAPLRDAVDDGIEGLIFSPKRVEALAKRMRVLLGDAGLYARMAEAARRRVVCRHNWDQNARTILGTFC
jgi:glycosyltransferase involved in cell wall biosynthesis